MSKIELFHREIEVKVLLEVLGVYGVLALMLVGLYYLGPAITGFVTVTKQFNYTDEVNLEFSESGFYLWNLAKPGNLKSVKISGSMIGEGEAKVYAGYNGERHLIFDSEQLVEKPSGIFGITGLAVAEDEEEDKDNEEGEDKGEGKKPNHPPVWNSSAESFIVNGSLTINLNEYFNDKDGDVLTYSASGLKTNELGILLENEILTVNNENNIAGNRTLELIASDNETSKKKNVVLILIREIINETQITNETVEKMIDSNLEYGDNEIYDANNDGVESLDGVIDFTVKNSDFNWVVNGEKLCARYEIYSVENQESTFACFGNNDCCNFVDLQSSRALWDESLFLSYGSYGSSFDNIVFAQILYVDYNLSVDEPYSDVAYSSWSNLTARFEKDIIEFEDVCIDTCLFSGNASSYELIIEVEGGKLWIDKIKYLVEERVTNNYPILIKNIENISLMENKNYTLDLNEYFSDEDNDALVYSYFEIDNITVRFENDFAYIMPDEGFTGSRFTFITANDSYGKVVSNMFKVEVRSGELSIEISDSTIVDDKWTVSFKTIGTGNLTISTINASYTEMYDDNVSTINDLEILELKCGEFEIFDKDDLIETEGIWFVLMNKSKVKLIDLIGESLLVKSIYVENYNCDNKAGHYTTRVLTDDITLELDFSNKTKIAGIEHVERAFRETFEIRDKEDNALMVLDSFGNVNIKGNLTENVFVGGDENDFIVQNATDILMVITNPEGNMLIKGSLNENQSILLPTPNSFIIQNRAGDAVAYVNSTGSLFLKGILTENVLFD